MGNCLRCAEITTEFDAEELLRWAAQLTDDYLPENWQRVSSSGFARVAFNRERQLYYKEYLPRSPAASLKGRVSGSRATRARRNSDALLLAGIDAPRNMFWGKHPNGHEFLFTVAAPGVGINHWLREIREHKSAEQLRLRRQFLHSLGTFIGRVHATGFILGDLRPGNVLAEQLQDQFRFTLIDNERNTRNTRNTPTAGKMLLRNLMQLNMLPNTALSRADRMRFFRAWRRQMRDLSPMEAKILAAEVYNKARRRKYAKEQT